MPNTALSEAERAALATRAENIAAHRLRATPLSAQAPARLDIAASEEARKVESERRAPVQTPTNPQAELSWKQRLRLLPLVGPVLGWIRSLLRLNATRRDIAELNDRLVRLEAMDIANRLARSEAGLHRLEERFDRIEAINAGNRLNRFDALDIANRLHVFDDVNIANRLNRLEALAGAAADAGAGDGGASAAAPPTLDAFYVDFESEFRGERQDIKDRFAVYLPYLENLPGEAQARVIDVGCGRGEWLELLAEKGIAATGIDLNAALVGDCQARGLAAECVEAVGYLRRQPPASVAAVTAFHLVEHLPFATLIALFDAALQALRPGGLFIFETPNPENLAVGACNFHFDPTHRHPIVPMVGEFITRQRGYARAEILRLHPYPDDHLVREDSEAARRLNKLLYGAQDYAVLAWKAHAA